GRGEAREARAAAVPAPRAPLADPARPLHLQGARSRMLALPGGRSVLLSEQGARAADWQRQAGVDSVIGMTRPTPGAKEADMTKRLLVGAALATLGLGACTAEPDRERQIRAPAVEVA